MLTAHVHVLHSVTHLIFQCLFVSLEKASSFVGTAQYVSPELLQSKVAYKRLERSERRSSREREGGEGGKRRQSLFFIFYFLVQIYGPLDALFISSWQDGLHFMQRMLTNTHYTLIMSYYCTETSTCAFKRS